ncbi:MAG: PQQ-binding-like beta-propeller repeat protein [Bryobacterales bacterium]
MAFAFSSSRRLPHSPFRRNPLPILPPARQFEARCGGCHGGDGKGGPRAPDIVTPSLVPSRSAEQVRTLILEGLPSRGMPPIATPEPELTQLVAFYLSVAAPAFHTPPEGGEAAVKRGEGLFFQACANCHTRGPNAKVIGPDLSRVGLERTYDEIERSIVDPSATIEPGYELVEVTVKGREPYRAFARNRSPHSLQLQTLDGRFEFLSRGDYESVKALDQSLMGKRERPEADVQALVAFLSRQDGKTGALAKLRGRTLPGDLTADELLKPAPSDWPTYNGVMSGNRHSLLEQITPANVSSLRPAWEFPLRDAPRDLEMTPVVHDGVMYVTTANTVVALDAEHGRQIWSWQIPRTKGVLGDAGTGANRGVALMGDKVFYVTDHAHVVALDRLTGHLLWDTEMADFHDHYGGTIAPLAIKDMVIAGVGGGDEGIRGFLAAYDQNTGEERWRFWTIPLPGEPLSETWKGSVLPHGCAGTWLTGTFDPDLDTLYWPTGNPCPDMNGDEREGDNLYSDSMLALDPNTGKLKWHYQYTPHDEFDWDANQTPVLVDADWRGRVRKLLLHANRNGFFYVLDRTNGEVLLAKPFIEKLDWATGIDANGRPVLAPDKRPTFAGNVVCPGIAGATNWPSQAYNPGTGLFYVNSVEYCNLFTKNEEKWERGKGFGGGAAKRAAGDTPERHLRAIDIQTGAIKWDVYHGDHGWRTWGGVLSTTTGLIFFGEDSGAFSAVRADTGEPVWSYQLNAAWRASPMTYAVGGKQYVGVAASKSVVVFALPE